MLVPETVATELQEASTPAVVRAWLLQPPAWCEMRPDPPPDATLEFLDPGERAAITLALAARAERILIDDWDGRAEAERRHLHVTGTLGVLADAHQHSLLDFEAALERLRETSFYMSDALIERVRRIFLLEGIMNLSRREKPVEVVYRLLISEQRGLFRTGRFRRTAESASWHHPLRR